MRAASPIGSWTSEGSGPAQFFCMEPFCSPFPPPIQLIAVVFVGPAYCVMAPGFPAVRSPEWLCCMAFLYPFLGEEVVRYYCTLLFIWPYAIL
ncbi:hypothetical protein [Pasteuria penetrans]|uniref:hypothetical protein n=1 Tax=Pasteuria penetrans TaxID=86005 RepID=UPI000FBADE8C|nr:hypothetical protein [Pasteuria penetrans]